MSGPCTECKWLEYFAGEQCMGDPESGYYCGNRDYRTVKEEDDHLAQLSRDSYRNKVKSCCEPEMVEEGTIDQLTQERDEARADSNRLAQKWHDLDRINAGLEAEIVKLKTAWEAAEVRADLAEAEVSKWRGISYRWAGDESRWRGRADRAEAEAVKLRSKLHDANCPCFNCQHHRHLLHDTTLGLDNIIKNLTVELEHLKERHEIELEAIGSRALDRTEPGRRWLARHEELKAEVKRLSGAAQEIVGLLDGKVINAATAKHLIRLYASGETRAVDFLISLEGSE